MDFRPELSWEFLSVDEIGSKTLRALRNHVRYVKEVSSYYHSELQAISADDISSLDDFTAIPFTERENIVRQSSKFLSVNAEQIAETVLTSGTTGEPMPFLFTRGDLDRVAFSNALSLHGTGMRSSDRVQLFSSLDRFSIDGIAHYRGALMTGANVMRIGIGVFQDDLLKRYLQFFRPSVIIGAASALSSITDTLCKNSFDIAACKIQKIIATSESLYTRHFCLNNTGNYLEKNWCAKVFSMYLTTELSASYCDCEYRNGAHSPPELVYTEIVDADGKPLPDGEIGELVVTPLGVEAVPLLRYKTGDITFKVPKSCSCGRNSSRIGPILGRKTEAFRYNNTIIYPPILADVLNSIDEIKDYELVLECDAAGMVVPTVHAATPPVALEKVALSIRSAIGISIPVLVSNIPTIQAMRQGAGIKGTILDNRKKNSLLKR